MGKSVPSPTKLQDFARIIGSNTPRRRPTQVKPPVSRTRSVSPAEGPKLKGLVGGLESPSSERRLRRNKMEEESSNGNSSEEQRLRRIPLAEVVTDCVRRWFQDTLKEAKAGDISMQVLVGQMYFSGYGVSRDAQKGKAWISRASRTRSSAWKVSDKRPGYNVSDSDSDDTAGEAK
ncbi:PREDICTED: uncharacterized protein LOC109154969 [Ipomoea nil]|uniref:uncharacterized protein LOC109154969 n=1 Tax=Ipomoea nil TaxID=35883 RepID=UPI0009013768|nr:PREDICTED: uncharacterized protein LOC109154969 [Ipomoea nil]XP_019158243.1 PREDICTED: uncharacterized protein LOC109154969 [Ipomoea nil]